MFIAQFRFNRHASKETESCNFSKINSKRMPFVQSQNTWPLTDSPDLGLKVPNTDKAALFQTPMAYLYLPAY